MTENGIYSITEAVEDWMLSIPPNEIDHYLSHMQLKRDGSMFAKLDRLSRCVLGEYTPRDFEESEGSGDVITRRKTLRDELLRRVISEDDGTFVQTSNWRVHPLDVVLRSEVVMNVIGRTTASASPDTQHTQHGDTTVTTEQNTRNKPEEGATETHEDERSNVTQDADNDESQSQSRGMMRLLASDGSEFRVPREFGALLAELIVKVRSLEETVLDRQRLAASSTHIAEGRTGQNVQFADTYTIHGDDNWMGPPPTPPPARRDGQAGLPGVSTALGVGGGGGG